MVLSRRKFLMGSVAVVGAAAVAPAISTPVGGRLMFQGIEIIADPQSPLRRELTDITRRAFVPSWTVHIWQSCPLEINFREG